MVPNKTVSLSKAAIGEPVQLVSLSGGKGLKRRLAELGLTPGVKLRVLQDCGGPLLVAIRSSRIALGRGMANKIIVAPIGSGSLGKTNPDIDRIKDAQR